MAGKLVPDGGDIKITVTRPPGVVSGQNQQDWGLKIEAVNGGLINSDGQESVTYAAPDGGYQPSETFTLSTSNNTWYQAIHQGVLSDESQRSNLWQKLGTFIHHIKQKRTQRINGYYFWWNRQCERFEKFGGRPEHNERSRKMKRVARIIIVAVSVAEGAGMTFFTSSLWGLGNAFGGSGDGAGSHGDPNGEMLATLIIAIVWLVLTSPTC